MFDFILLHLHRRAGRLLRRKGKITPEKVAGEAVTFATASGWKWFNDKAWRELIRFDEKTENEVDFMFNEVFVTVLVFAHASLKEMVSHLPGERREFWRQVADAFLPSYIGWLKQQSIPNPDMWEKLFKLRADEYQEMQSDTWEEFSSRLNTIRSEASREASVRVMTLAAMAMMHISRGQHSDTDEEAIRYVQEHLGNMARQAQARFGW